MPFAKYRPKVVFWINDIDSILLSERVPDTIGGANIQMAFWAVEFAKNGYKPFSFTFKFKRNLKEIHGIRFMYIPLIRKFMFLINLLKPLWLLYIKPDVIITRSNPDFKRILVFLSKKSGVRIIHMLASDSDFNNKEISEYIQKVGGVIAQNQFQYHQIEDKLNTVKTKLIKSIWNNQLVYPYYHFDKISFDVIWIGNIRSVKRPLWLIDLAKNLPQYRFALVGKAVDMKLEKQILKAATNIQNLHILGYKNIDEVQTLLENSRVLLCTSIFEGFPNTFLQAWSLNKPIVATVNPNNVFDDYKLGFYQTELDLICNRLELLLNNENIYDSICEHIATYFEYNHNPATNFNLFQNFLQEI